MRNPLTQVTGPEFLVLVAIITMVAAVCWWWKWNRDTSASLAPLPPPKTIDPYELAYFRAGDKELARVLILKLIETEYLRVVLPPWSFWRGTPPKRLEQNPYHPPVANLAPIERQAFEYFDVSRTATDVFRPDKTLTQVDLPTALGNHTVKYEHRLRAERLLTSDESRDAARRNIFVGIAIVVAIGVTRSFVGISPRWPVVLMAIAGIAAIAMIGRTGRLSRRGKNYLKATQDAWLSVKERSAQGDWNPTLAASVFGFGVLAGTEMAPVNDMFVRARHSDWDRAGGCGGCGGGGCGGGCGGCGGGCGGCGGG